MGRSTLWQCPVTGLFGKCHCYFDWGFHRWNRARFIQNTLMSWANIPHVAAAAFHNPEQTVLGLQEQHREQRWNIRGFLNSTKNHNTKPRNSFRCWYNILLSLLFADIAEDQATEWRSGKSKLLEMVNKKQPFHRLPLPSNQRVPDKPPPQPTAPHVYEHFI